MSTTDRIEKEVVLKAPRARVWRALADSAEFGSWFRVRVDGPFRVGEWARGHVLHPGYEHVRFEILVETMDEPERIVWHWHPYAVEVGVDYSSEPMTRVEFTLTEVRGGTLLRVVESGFDRLPPERRDEAFRMNSGGWEAQVENVRVHVAP
jgi:uncharacterized protein YndB with AHSA1/START domain